MKGESSWENLGLDGITRDYSISKLDSDEAVEVPVYSLPDDLLERILVCLPIASVLRAGCVCKRWHRIVSSLRVLQNFSRLPPEKPWYFMFTSSDEPIGYAYDPIVKKWHSIQLPCIEASNWFIASSFGLVCFMDSESRSRWLYVCNPITKCYRRIEDPHGLRLSDYSALAISVERTPCGLYVNYRVTLVKSKQVRGNFFEWDVSIHVYDSETTAWESASSETLSGWRAGNDSVICGGVLYFLVHSTSGDRGPRHGLISYNLSSRGARSSLMTSFIPVPGSLTCGRLMNHKGCLMMVGGIAKRDRPDIIKGIGIWALNGRREWEEITRMPHKFFQGFGELDDVFASSGTDDVIYIQSYGAPALLIFYVDRKQWRWSNKCPVTKRFPLQLFTGFCFEPRLDIAP